MSDLIKITNDELPFEYNYVIIDNATEPETSTFSSNNQLIDLRTQRIFNDEFVGYKFEKNIRTTDKQDYVIAACSGLLCAALDIFWVKDLPDFRNLDKLEETRNWGSDKIENFVKTVAKKKAGYKGDDLADAIAALEKEYPLAADKAMNELGGAKQHHLRDFAHHPTIIGLIFSLFSQFSGYACGTDVNGNFKTVKLPEDAFRGKNVVERIFYGTVGWVFHLISDMAGSNQTPGAGTGIPGPLLSFFKEISSLPFVKELAGTDNKGIHEFSRQISKWFNGTHFKDDNHPKGIRFDLRAEIGVAHQFSKQFVPVIINECIVRSFYFIKHLFLEIKDHEIYSLKDLKHLNPENFIPFKNRTVVRMCTVASGVFTTIDVSGAAVKALKKCDGDVGDFVVNFLLNINYPGIGRFAFACFADTKYICEDVAKAYREYKERKIISDHKEGSGIKYFELTSEQAQILHSLKLQKILHDIGKTDELEEVTKKSAWMNEWKQFVESETKSENYFIENEDELYNIIRNNSTGINDNWIYQVLLELFVFAPYYPLNKESAKKYKGLKCKFKYEEEIFCGQQKVINKEILGEYKKNYIKYINELRNQKEKMIGSLAATVVLTVVSGGLAFAFAPQIAILLAGESVAGLSGVALTNASLALIGGGSLAAGGLGMAGGTAIITGGGALIAATGTGVATISSSVLMTSKAYALRECAKLLTFSKCIIIGKYGLYDVALDIAKSIHNSIDDLADGFEKLKEDEKMDDKTKKRVEKETKESIKYLKRCESEAFKMLKSIELTRYINNCTTPSSILST